MLGKVASTTNTTSATSTTTLSSKTNKQEKLTNKTQKAKKKEKKKTNAYLLLVDGCFAKFLQGKWKVFTESSASMYEVC